jgi:hypothetical protein
MAIWQDKNKKNEKKCAIKKALINFDDQQVYLIFRSSISQNTIFHQSTQNNNVMEINFRKDFFTLLGLIILEELFYFTIWETISGPRSQRVIITQIGSVVMLLITAIILYRRYLPLKISILYGALFGVFGYLPVHLIQHPTVTNWYIIGYKLVLPIVFTSIFQPILNNQFKKMPKYNHANNPDILDDQDV